MYEMNVTVLVKNVKDQDNDRVFNTWDFTLLLH